MSTHSAPRLAQPGLYRGYVLRTPAGDLNPTQQRRVVAHIRANLNALTAEIAHKVRLVLEGRAGVEALDAEALAALRRLTVAALA